MEGPHRLRATKVLRLNPERSADSQASRSRLPLRATPSLPHHISQSSRACGRLKSGLLFPKGFQVETTTGGGYLCPPCCRPSVCGRRCRGCCRVSVELSVSVTAHWSEPKDHIVALIIIGSFWNVLYNYYK